MSWPAHAVSCSQRSSKAMCAQQSHRSIKCCRCPHRCGASMLDTKLSCSCSHLLLGFLIMCREKGCLTCHTTAQVNQSSTVSMETRLDSRTAALMA